MLKCNVHGYFEECFSNFHYILIFCNLLKRKPCSMMKKTQFLLLTPSYSYKHKPTAHIIIINFQTFPGRTCPEPLMVNLIQNYFSNATSQFNNYNMTGTEDKNFKHLEDLGCMFPLENS